MVVMYVYSQKVRFPTRAPCILAQLSASDHLNVYRDGDLQ